MTGVLIFLAGLIVSIAWSMDWYSILSLVPGEVTMKFSTAQMFMFAGSALAFRQHPAVGYGAAAVIVYILIKMGISWWWLLDFYFAEKDLVTKTLIPGLPSIGTFLGFFIIVLGLMIRRAAKAVAAFLVGLGSLGMLGYALDAPVLYWHFPNASTAMAIHTAFLFIACGFAFQRGQECSSPKPLELAR